MLDLNAVSKMNKDQLRFTDKQIKRYQNATQNKDLINGFIQAINNPAVALIGSVVLLEALRKQDVITFGTAGILEGAMVGSTMINAIAKSGIISEITKASNEAGGKVGNILPLLLAAGG